MVFIVPDTVIWLVRRSWKPMNTLIMKPFHDIRLSWPKCLIILHILLPMRLNTLLRMYGTMPLGSMPLNLDNALDILSTCVNRLGCLQPKFLLLLSIDCCLVFLFATDLRLNFLWFGDIPWILRHFNNLVSCLLGWLRYVKFTSHCCERSVLKWLSRWLRYLMIVKG